MGNINGSWATFARSRNVRTNKLEIHMMKRKIAMEGEKETAWHVYGIEDVFRITLLSHAVPKMKGKQTADGSFVHLFFPTTISEYIYELL